MGGSRLKGNKDFSLNIPYQSKSALVGSKGRNLERDLLSMGAGIYCVDRSGGGGEMRGGKVVG